MILNRAARQIASVLAGLVIGSVPVAGSAAATSAADIRFAAVRYPVLIGAGDIASCSSTTDSATAAILGRVGGTVFTVGDNVYADGTAQEFAGCYGPTWGRFKARTRPATGNHDYHTAGAAGYFAYFGSRAGVAGRGYYAYNLGTWRIYVLNSNCDEVSCAAGSPQERWLRADLAANPHRCILAYWHHPLFSSGRHGNDPAVRPFWTALQGARAEVVVNGHDHDYERFRRQTPLGRYTGTGIREFVVGTGGAGLRPFGTIQPNSLVRNSTAHGVLRFALYPRSFSWRFIPIAGRSFNDSGVERCH